MHDSPAPAADRRQRRFLLILLAAAFAVVLLLLGYQLWSGYGEAQREAATRTRNYAAIIEARLDATLRRADSVLQTLVQEVPAAALNQAAVPDHVVRVTADLDRDMINFEELAGLRIFDADGNLLYSSATARAPRTNIAVRNYFRRVRDDPQAGLVFSEVIDITSTGRRSIVAARGMRAADGRFLGLALAVIELERFSALFRSLDIGPSGVFVIRRSDDFSGIVRWPEIAREINRPLPPGNPVREAMLAGRTTGTLEFAASSDGVVRTYSYRIVAGYPFFVLVAQARDDALAGWRERSLAVGAAGLLLLALLVALLARLWRMEAREARAVRALQSSEERLRLALAASGQGLYDLDLKTGEAVVDAAHARMLGYEPGEFDESNAAFMERLHPDDRAPVVQAFRDYVAGRVPEYRVEFRQRARDGRYKWILSVGKVVERDLAGAPRRMLGTHIDIGDRKAAEDALRDLNAELESRVSERTAELVAARDEAERASRAKSEFLSSMSHELRTPLNAILGFGQLLAADPAQRLPAQQQRYVNEILQAGRHLLALISDLLDLARIEAGKQQISLEPVQVRELVGECLRLMEPVARAHRLTLPAGAGGTCDCVVRADRTRLRQVLLNLLSNAIKYNREGGSVRLDCAAEGEAVVVSVTDTGHGLSPEQKQRLFQSFERLETGRRSVEGVGIGLALSKRLVELMHGEIGVQSEVGVGSTFWVRLARADASASEPAAQAQAGGSASDDGDETGRGARTVLYIEKDPVNAALMQAIFADEPGLRLIIAARPEAGVERARAERPDLILLDLQLPGIDGHELLRRLRADEATRLIPVVAVGANAMPYDVERGWDAGFVAYLTTPLDVRRVQAVVNGVLATAR